MKSIKLNFILAVLLLLVLSCETSTVSNNSNTLSIDGEAIELNDALLMNWGEWNGNDESYNGYRMILGLYSPEVNFILEDEEINGLTGTGYGIEFELFTENPQNISNREFLLSSSYTENTFSFAVVYTDLNFAEAEMQDGSYISDGSLNLGLNSNQITLTAQLVLVNGKEVTLNYSGRYLFLEPYE